MLSAILEENYSGIFVEFKRGGNATSFVSGTAIFSSQNQVLLIDLKGLRKSVKEEKVKMNALWFKSSSRDYFFYLRSFKAIIQNH